MARLNSSIALLNQLTIGWLFLLQFTALLTAQKAPDLCGAVYIDSEQPEARPQSVPLTAVNVRADVRGWTVGVVSELVYVNVLNKPIECHFVFPLADTAAVYRLDAVVAGRNISAQVKEREIARTEYNEAVKKGHLALLLENQEGTTDIYRLKLGNLPPNETAVVTVGYVQPIDNTLDDGIVSFTLPVVLNPRYVPRQMIKNPEKSSENFHLTVPYVAVSELKYKISFHAKVKLGLVRRIVDIRARHLKDTLEVVYNDKRLAASVQLVVEFEPDHDFQLLIQPESAFRPAIFVEPGLPVAPGKTSTWLNKVIAGAFFRLERPPLGETYRLSNNEYWLVLDRSGSMDGSKFDDAKSALVIFVKSLPYGCKFNIIGFGSTFTALFPDGLVDYSEKSVEVAMSHADLVEPDLGGTEVMEPLRYIYRQPLIGARRFVILLTDGEVHNTEEVIALVQQNAANTRVMSIGIGEGASSALINSVARVSNGLADFVRSSNDRLQAKVVALLRATTEPSADGASLDWRLRGGQLVSTVPSKIKAASIYAGRSFTQFGVIEREPGKELAGMSTFRAEYLGVSNTTRLGFAVPPSVFYGENDPLPLHRLSAKMMLVALSDQYRTDQSEKLRNKAIALSIETGVLCEFTALVGIEKSFKVANVSDGSVTKIVQIPQATVYDIETLDDMDSNSPLSRIGPVSAQGTASMGRGMGTVNGLQVPANSQWQLMGATVKKAVTVHSPLQDQLRKLVDAQTYSGSWLLPDILMLIDASIGDIHSFRLKVANALNADVSNNNGDQIIATATGITLLRTRFSDFKEDWQLVEQKAVAFLRSKGYPGPVDIFVLQLATTFNF